MVKTKAYLKYVGSDDNELWLYSYCGVGVTVCVRIELPCKSRIG